MNMSVPDPARYARHLALPEIGAAGQQKLAASSVLVVGAGGLGSPSSLYLAAAGVGRIGLLDHDRIEMSNLHRQVLFTTVEIGQEIRVEHYRAVAVAIRFADAMRRKARQR